MIWEILTDFLGFLSLINGITAFHMYRQYLKLAYESVEFTEHVITSIEEEEDGSVSIDLLSLAVTSMDHVSQLSGLLKWIKI